MKVDKRWVKVTYEVKDPGTDDFEEKPIFDMDNIRGITNAVYNHLKPNIQKQFMVE